MDCSPNAFAVHPAPLAFDRVHFLDPNGASALRRLGLEHALPAPLAGLLRRRRDRRLGRDEDVLEVVHGVGLFGGPLEVGVSGELLEQGSELRFLRVHLHLAIHRRADELSRPGKLHALLDVSPQLNDLGPRLGAVSLKLLQIPPALEHRLARGLVRKVQPNVLRHVRQNRSHQLGHAFHEDLEHCLAAAATSIRRGANVEAVLGDVQVKAREVACRELEQRLARAEELVVLVGISDFGRHLGEAPEDELVHRSELVVRHRIGGRVEVLEVPDKVTRRVAQAAVRLEDLLDDVVADANVRSVVH
mmetsp:Transcript_2228/g.4768  ORF Transcript_2228/g.4768 Transcript_2228/m.4768 type:complete len:304 (+) Transcript_2228:447-1358(+)